MHSGTQALNAKNCLRLRVALKLIKRMMNAPNTVVYTIKAARQLRKIPRSDSVRILQACAALENFPDCTNVKALAQHTQGFRLRVGDYRILFDFDGTVRVVSIEEVKKRNERTY